MSKACRWGVGGGTIVILVIVVVLLVVLIPRKGKKDDPPIMYIAMHVGNAHVRTLWKPTQLQKSSLDDCSLDVNKRHTLEAVLALKDVEQRYALILFSKTMNTTAPMSRIDALAHLLTIESVTESTYSQESIAKAYTSRRSSDDLFVFYIPCDFGYRKDDEDMRAFVAELRSSSALDKTLIISNTQTSRTVADLYDLKEENVAGEEQDISGRISDFGHSIISTRSTRSPHRTTTARNTTISTSAVSTNTQTSITSRTKTRGPSTKPTSSTSTVDPPRSLNCIFVADMYNYRNDIESYTAEAELLSAVAYDIFDEADAKIGLWAYGNTDFPKNVSETLKDMTKDYEELNKRLSQMKYIEISNPKTTRMAVDMINDMHDKDGQVNCLVFLSAKKDTLFHDPLNPRHLRLKRVIVIGLSGTNPSELVPARIGELVSVPFFYVESHIRAIVDAIFGRTTTTTSTTQSSSSPPTTTKPLGPLKCLFVVDFYSFGTKTDAYIQEQQFIAYLGYDFFTALPNAKAALWAYGHTNMPQAPNLDKMCKTSSEFQQELINMEYKYDSEPMSTAGAIKVINDLNDDDNRINCLVFFSAQNGTALPILNPQPAIRRIVGADLTWIAGRGIAMTVPYYWLDIDIRYVLNAIMGRYQPTTTTKTTERSTTGTQQSTTTTQDELKCLFVGDLYNFGNYSSSYLDEASFIYEIATDYFSDKSTITNGGLWAYGYSAFPQSPDLNKINNNFTAFSSDIQNMKYHQTDNPMTPARAIEIINNLPANDKRVNCIVFFCAPRNASALPKLNPLNKKIKRIVGVGLVGTDLSYVVEERGVAVSVFYYFSDDRQKVLQAIFGRHRTTTAKQTTHPTPASVTAEKTTTKAFSQRKCLFVGDLYTPFKTIDSYAIERKFIEEVGHHFFMREEDKPLAGIWAYGYTTFPRTPDLNKIRNNFDEFKDDLVEMEFFGESENPTSTAWAINMFNQQKSDSRINCLIFFSAQNNTQFLPELDPGNKRIKHLVVVGFAGADMSEVVGRRGVDVTVPLYYKPTDVDNVLNAILNM
ncbi:unnamed protein product [Cylicocyclus nassatus]|uniref:Uncharacterized protein n=1 Tax=Cylicocyclus nassatus TaxID=53992 RepID=A0AA36H6D2_CYLNA|nr:unnamed protein product [Cylicocyclus nassatus]